MITRDIALEPLRQLVTYMHVTWIDGPLFKPVDWCVFRQSIRTNNDVEGWHQRLNRLGKRSAISLYLLCQLLQHEGDSVTETARLVFQEEIRRIQHQGNRNTSRLHKFWTEYEQLERSAQSLLVAVGHLICAMVDAQDEQR